MYKMTIVSLSMFALLSGSHWTQLDAICTAVMISYRVHPLRTTLLGVQTIFAALLRGGFLSIREKNKQSKKNN